MIRKFAFFGGNATELEHPGVFCITAEQTLAEVCRRVGDEEGQWWLEQVALVSIIVQYEHIMAIGRLPRTNLPLAGVRWVNTFASGVTPE